MLDQSFINGMKSLSITCSLCLWNGLFKDYEEHLTTTHSNPICEFCEEKFDSTIRLDEHKQKECIKITTTTNKNINKQMQRICETRNILPSGIQILNDDTQSLSSESSRLLSSIQSLAQHFSSIKFSIQEESSFLNGIKINQEILQQDIESLKQKIDNTQYVSYDGTFTWRITHIYEKMCKFNLKKTKIILLK
ncbi:unnamed protein product [Rotaria sp. Silwood1]|nr:unnamed protein product [Rotaria sp. Silwood1]CAF1646433.1 unnamed protein product [Rotaria sp. Silwood1]CAF3959367.1 unnamed protein product [Rotaria sp. Silwood1]